MENISVTIGEETYNIDLEIELAIAEDTINDNLKTQSAKFAWYAVLQELAEAALAEAKLSLEVIEAQLDGVYRKKLAGEGGKVTETLLRNQLVLDDSYLKAVGEYNLAKKNVGLMKAVKDGFIHRKDMLVTLASNMRAQADPEIFIKKEEFKKTMGGKS